MKKYKYTKSFTIDGQRYKVYADTKEALMVKYVHKKEEVENGLRSISRDMTVKDWAEEWLGTYKSGVSVSTYKTYESRLKNSILPEIGHLRLKNVRQIHVQKILNGLQNYGKGTVQITFTVLKQIFQTAYDNGLIIVNPAENLHLPKLEGKRRRRLTDQERGLIISLSEGTALGTALKLSLYCGLRPGEAMALQWRSVDEKNKVITVDSTVKVDGSIGKPKSKAGNRKIPVPDHFRLERPKGASPFHFVITNTSRHYTRNQYFTGWHNLVNKINLSMGCKEMNGRAVPPFRAAEDLVPYLLRHTYCTDLQDAGVPINVAKELMGHSSIEMTARIYTHSSEVAFEKARHAINLLKSDTFCDTQVK